MDFEVTVIGIPKIRNKLDQMSDVDARTSLQTACREGAKVFMLESRRILRAMGRSHSTVMGVIVRSKKVSRYFVRSSVGYDKKQAQLNFLEFGAPPHDIPQDYVDKLGRHVKRTIKHPGFSPKPWLRPAFDTKHELAMDVFELVIWREIKKRVGS